MEEKRDFRFPRHIAYCGRFMTAKRIADCRGTIVCVYADDDLGVETSFTERDFKYQERYGHIERRTR